MIEIKELVVRAIVINGAPPGEAQRSADTGNSHDQAQVAGSAPDIMIEDCVRQVLAILERQKER